MQGLAVIGIWLPALSFAHIGLSSEQDVFDAAIMACTGILFFSPILIWSMQNRVMHIQEQSQKAGRVSRASFYATIPHVSLAEECVTMRGVLHSADGPAHQKQWARALAVHQLHLNLIAITFALISPVGSLGIISGVTVDVAGKTNALANRRLTR